MNKIEQKIYDIAKRKGLLRPVDLDEEGIWRQYLYPVYRKGIIKRIGRGLYALPEYEIGEYFSLSEVSKLVPSCVICLLSALNYHELSTQSPSQVWIGIDRKSRKPKITNYQVEVVRCSRSVLYNGTETHVIGGVDVKITNPAKTIADCFKYRNKIGLDVAIEALKDCIRKRKATVDELVEYGQECRVAKVMTPYIEAIL